MSEFASILIVDDEDLFRESTCRLLQKEGFHCHCAADPEKALTELQDYHYDILLSDIRMPCNEDLQFVRKALDLYSGMAVILVTGYPSTETTIQAIELPIVAYLTKPFKPKELLGHIQEALKSSQQRRAITAAIERLHSVIADLEVYQSRPRPRHVETDIIPLETIRTIASCLSQLLDLPAKSTCAREATNLCELLDCQQKSTYRSAIVETVEILRTTKHLFKSKILAELRKKLEGLLES